MEIGLFNYVIDFYDSSEEEGEVVTEQMACNSMILCDIAFIKAKERLDEWNDMGFADLAMQCNSRLDLFKTLKAKYITEVDHASLQEQ